MSTTLAHRFALKRRAVHAACKAQAIDTDTRHALQRRLTGKDSLSKMTLAELDTVLDYLNRASGYQGQKGKPHNFDHKPYLWKIEALLADMKLPWAYADAIAENITGGKKPDAIQKLAWVKEEKHFKGIIAALHAEQQKRARLETIDGFLKKLGETRDDVAKLIAAKRPGYTGNWPRDARMLEALCKYYAERMMAAEAA